MVYQPYGQFLSLIVVTTALQICAAFTSEIILFFLWQWEKAQLARHSLIVINFGVQHQNN